MTRPSAVVADRANDRCEVHLVEMSLLAEHRYSATLGYLHAAIRSDAGLDDSLDTTKHVLDSRPQQLEQSIEEVLAGMHDPRVVAFTVYFWNRGQSVELARRVKSRWPGCVIVFGGNDVTNQQAALFGEAPWVDVLVHGEGELRFPQLCRAVLSTGPTQQAPDPAVLAEIPGISYRSDDEIVTTGDAPRITDLDVIPSPLLSDVYTDADIAGTRLIIYETNRGCPYSCSFCYWGGATKSKVRQFSMERVAAELDRLVRAAAPGSSVFVADANFGILGRDLQIAQLFVRLCHQYGKRLTFMTNWAKNSSSKVVEIAAVLHEHGLSGPITLSAQSFDEGTLQIANRSNIRPDRYRTLQAEFRSRGIPTYTDLIWGLPGETYQRHLDGIEHVLQSGGCPVVYPLLLLNNTEYASDGFGRRHPLQIRRLPCDVSNQALVADVVVGHPQMTPTQWVRGMQHLSATGVFAKAAMRCTLRYLSVVGEARIVDLVDTIMDVIGEAAERRTAAGTGIDADLAQLRAVQDNHARCLLHPDAIDEQLLLGHLGEDAMAEDRHYQAMLHLMLDDSGRQRRLAGFLTDVLVRRHGLAGKPGMQYLPGVLSLDAVAGSVWRTGIAHQRLTGTFAAAPQVLDVLIASGDLPEWDYDPAATVVHGRCTAKRERVDYSLSMYSLALLKGARRLLWDAETTVIGGSRQRVPVPG